jgi:8-oxo-dGTP pyrophosphatase MutT (NUDIX family)
MSCQERLPPKNRVPVFFSSARRAKICRFFLATRGARSGARKIGVWTLPKGLIAPGEDPLAAQREFAEETGHVPQGEFISSATRSSREARSFTYEKILNGQAIFLEHLLGARLA